MNANCFKIIIDGGFYAYCIRMQILNNCTWAMHIHIALIHLYARKKSIDVAKLIWTKLILISMAPPKNYLWHSYRKTRNWPKIRITFVLRGVYDRQRQNKGQIIEKNKQNEYVITHTHTWAYIGWYVRWFICTLKFFFFRNQVQTMWRTEYKLINKKSVWCWFISSYSSAMIIENSGPLS